MTTTSSAVAVPGVAEADGTGVADADVAGLAVVEGLELAEVVMASCAVAMFATQNNVADVIKSFFMKIFNKMVL